MTSQLTLVESATTKLIRQILGEVGGIWGDVQNVLAEQIRQLVYGIRTYAFDRNLMVVTPRSDEWMDAGKFVLTRNHPGFGAGYSQRPKNPLVFWRSQSGVGNSNPLQGIYKKRRLLQGNSYEPGEFLQGALLFGNQAPGPLAL